MGCLADVAQILQHPARIRKGRVVGHRLVRKPIAYVRGKRDRAATHEEDVIRQVAQRVVCLNGGRLEPVAIPPAIGSGGHRF